VAAIKGQFIRVRPVMEYVKLPFWRKNMNGSKIEVRDGCGIQKSMNGRASRTISLLSVLRTMPERVKDVVSVKLPFAT